MQLQQEDLVHLGQLILSLACGSLGSLLDLKKAFDYIANQYSHEVKDVIMYLLSTPTAQKSILDVAAMLTHRLFQEFDNSLRFRNL